MDQLNTITNSSSGSTDGSNNSSSSRSSSRVWRRVLSPTVVLAVSSPLVLIANIGLVIVFLLQQNWQGVILSSIAFIAWTQVIYWYFRARTLLQIRSDANDSEVVDDDMPPPYEEVIKTEAPPPSYYMVVSEGGWSSGTYSNNTHVAQEDPHPSNKNKFSGLCRHQQAAPNNVCGGITAPYLHHITSDECSHTLATSSNLNDHVQIIRAPIDREISHLAVPIHKPAPTRLTSRDILQDADHRSLAS